jgi:hypothetical protein
VNQPERPDLAFRLFDIATGGPPRDVAYVAASVDTGTQLMPDEEGWIRGLTAGSEVVLVETVSFYTGCSAPAGLIPAGFEALDMERSTSGGGRDSWTTWQIPDEPGNYVALLRPIFCDVLIDATRPDGSVVLSGKYAGGLWERGRPVRLLTSFTVWIEDETGLLSGRVKVDSICQDRVTATLDHVSARITIRDTVGLASLPVFTLDSARLHDIDLDAGPDAAPAPTMDHEFVGKHIVPGTYTLRASDPIFVVSPATIDLSNGPFVGTVTLSLAPHGVTRIVLTGDAGSVQPRNDLVHTTEFEIAELDGDKPELLGDDLMLWPRSSRWEFLCGTRRLPDRDRWGIAAEVSSSITGDTPLFGFRVVSARSPESILIVMARMREVDLRFHPETEADFGTSTFVVFCWSAAAPGGWSDRFRWPTGWYCIVPVNAPFAIVSIDGVRDPGGYHHKLLYVASIGPEVQTLDIPGRVSRYFSRRE